ncbi:MAG TPA: antibiotic biosynthesis monooxygenase [Ferrovibrio sp.]|uniref:antibiotic biosynthesis monooxygenase family protein n=1 Tax=Ferrovibrio sp. TaxID=1917215 RepID=UPI002ED57B43
MIARIWQGWTTPDKVAAYRRHFTTSVQPHLQTLDGFRGCYLLESIGQRETAITAVTFWESLDAIKAFAGEDICRANVEDAAAAVLVRYNTTVEHHEVAVQAMPVQAAPVIPPPSTAG